MKVKPIKPVLRWPGGKTRMLKHLLPIIPQHTCYCEPFAGGLALLLAKPRSHVEVINDFNGDLVALYRCIQYHLPELLREVACLIASRELLKDYMAQPGLTDIQRAARFYYRNRISFGGGMRSFGVSRTRGGAASFRSATNSDLLGNARERLDGVIVENLDYARCIELYDSADTFFFLDPPYLNARPNAYEGWTEEQITAFAQRVRELKGKWIVTLDDSEFTRAAFREWNIIGVETRNGIVNNRLNPKSTFKEIIVTPEKVSPLLQYSGLEYPHVNSELHA